MFHGTAHVVLASGMTMADATFSLSFIRLPYFQSLGIPLAVRMVVAVFVALTFGPALITVASHFGLLEPKRAMRIRGWRRLFAVVVRWPALILLVTIVLAPVGVLALPGYRPNYNDRNYPPADLPANAGYAAVERHFPVARMNPELLPVETDHDVRNSADFLVIERIATYVMRTPGIGRVQAITRPEGKPLKYSTIPAQLSLGGTFQKMNRSHLQDRINDMLLQADEMQKTINTMEQMIALMEQMSVTTHSMVMQTHDIAAEVSELQDHIADFDDFWARFATTCTGSHIATTSRSAGRSGRSSTRWTASTARPKMFWHGKLHLTEWSRDPFLQFPTKLIRYPRMASSVLTPSRMPSSKPSGARR
jgi:RND superfamily putative drug exporter